MKKTSMLCINDTHATVYNYSNIEELLNWEEEVKNENSQNKIYIAFNIINLTENFKIKINLAFVFTINN